MTTWVAAKDIGLVPELGYRLRWGARPKEPIRLYWAGRYASPMNRYIPLFRWIDVAADQYEHELGAAARAGLPIMEVRAEVERMLRASQLRARQLRRRA